MSGRALGSAVEHSLHTRGVGGSNPPARTTFCFSLDALSIRLRPGSPRRGLGVAGWWPIATACLLALATAIFYGLALGRQPIGRDEARVVSQAQQPIQGVPLPVINAGDRWLQPLNVYATTLAHAVRPGFFAGRWASVTVAAISIGLLFMVGCRVFGGYIASLAAAFALIFMPAYMTYGRQGLEPIYIVPFVLIWLYALAGFIEKDRPSQIAVASAALGAGVYSTTAAPLTMAFLWLTMIAVLLIVRRLKLSTLGIAAACFVVMLGPLAIWFVLHRDTYMDTYGSWAIHAAHLRNPLDGFLAFINRNTLGTRASTYWSLFDPSYLFFASAEGRAPLHWVIAPLLAVGIYRCVTRPNAMATIVLAGTLVAPLAAASFGQPRYIANALALLPFLALLAGYGVDHIRELIVPPPPPPPDEEYETIENRQPM